MSWQKEAVVYQIYPRSFKDSNGDGIGDLQGIIQKLDYLKDLGIDVIWLSPIYQSPNDDNGYDISNYEKIMAEFGTMEDFDRLLQEVHQRGMKLIMDLVLNHTSDEHPWFIESRSSRDNPKRDWYIWKDGTHGEEPNNWESIFGGSVWEYDEKTESYYLHLFSKKMPDLNWENKEVREALYKMINRWLEKGIDGFRVDAITHIKKEDYEDLPNPKGLRHVPSFTKHMNKKGIHTFLQELKENTFSKYDIFTVGEANGVKAEEGILWAGEKEGKFNMIFQFEHLRLWNEEDKKLPGILHLKRAMTKWQNALHKVGWNALYMENHDLVRSVSKLGDDRQYRIESAKALGLMYFMQQGTPFIYQGQELGMTNARFESIDDYRDIESLNRYKEKRLDGETPEEALKEIWETSRDHVRTPMQWDDSYCAGFTTGTPWIKVNENYKEINAASENQDENSVLNFYKKMIRLKKSDKTLVYGEYKMLLENDPYVYAYTREDEENVYLVVCNLSKEDRTVELEYSLEQGEIMVTNYKCEQGKMVHKQLKPYEARLYKVL